MTFYGLGVFALLFQLNIEGRPPADYQALWKQGQTEYLQGHFDAAQKLFSEALKRTPLGNESVRATIDADLGSTYAKQEEFAKAEAAYLESLSMSRRLSNKAESALMPQNLGMLYSLQGRDQDALRFLNRAQDELKTVPNPDPKVAVELLNATGILNYRLRNNGKAETFFNKALQAAQASGARIDTTGILSNLGAVCVSQRKFKQAEEILGRALMIKEQDLGPAHPASDTDVALHRRAVYRNASVYGGRGAVSTCPEDPRTAEHESGAASCKFLTPAQRSVSPGRP
jgi:tetratricopeptide (TPR) repeat protein